MEITEQIISTVFALFILFIVWRFLRNIALSFFKINSIEKSQEEILNELKEIKAQLKIQSEKNNEEN